MLLEKARQAWLPIRRQHMHRMQCIQHHSRPQLQALRGVISSHITSRNHDNKSTSVPRNASRSVYSFGNGLDGKLGHGHMESVPDPKKLATLSNHRGMSYTNDVSLWTFFQKL